jgi:hypothetical protein
LTETARRSGERHVQQEDTRLCPCKRVDDTYHRRYSRAMIPVDILAMMKTIALPINIYCDNPSTVIARLVSTSRNSSKKTNHLATAFSLIDTPVFTNVVCFSVYALAFNFSITFTWLFSFPFSINFILFPLPSPSTLPCFLSLLHLYLLVFLCQYHYLCSCPWISATMLLYPFRWPFARPCPHLVSPPGG